MNQRLTDFLTQLNTATTAEKVWEDAIIFMENLGVGYLVSSSGKYMNYIDYFTPAVVARMKHYAQQNDEFLDNPLDHRIENLQPMLTDLPPLEKQVQCKTSDKNRQIIHIAMFYTYTVMQNLIREEKRESVSLTNREKECLLWLSRGMQSKQISNHLEIACITVDMHIGNAKRKLGGSTREHALALALELDLITQ